MTDTMTKPQSAADVFINLIVAFLAPMFLSVAGGDINFARAAAIETINAFRVRSNADLLSVAQIIAFGLAALGSLSLSMADDLSTSMVIRLRANAVSANRASEQCRRALLQPCFDTAAPVPPQDDDMLPDAAAIAATAEQARKQAAETNNRCNHHNPRHHHRNPSRQQPPIRLSMRRVASCGPAPWRTSPRK
jgi:hypothetical protein